MSIHLLILLIGIVAGLRAMTAPAAVSFGAMLGWLHLQGTPMAFMGYRFTPWILLLAALGELINNKLPKTPSRMIPAQFGTRLVTGAWAGDTLGAAFGSLWVGAIVGAVGAAIGTWSGHRARRGLADALHHDLPAALIEDAVAIGGAVLVVFAAS